MNYLERLGKPRGLGLLALAALLAAFAACQLVAGVQSRSLDPIASGCSLPRGSGPQVRFANLAPTADAVDVCLRSSGTSWGEPVILNGGSGCATTLPKTGFSYGQLTVAFTAPGSTVDVKTVAGGGTCSAKALSEADGIALASGATVTTLMHIGGGGEPLELVALPEALPSETGDIRFVHAMPGTRPLDFGSASNALMNHALPASLGVVFTTGSPVAYGSTPHKGDKTPFGPVSDGGYMTLTPSAYDLSAAVHGQTRALFLFKQFEVAQQNLSVYAIGLPSSALYPQAAILCNESAATPSAANALLLSCAPSDLPLLSFDTFNPALYGENAPDFLTRDPLLIGSNSPIFARDTDVMCLVEIDSAKDQQSVVAQAKASGYPYSYAITTELNTPFSNGGKTQDGGTCAPSTTAACAGVDMPTLNAALSCMEQNCSTENDDNGILNQSTDCLSNNCLSTLAPLLAESTPCFNCVVDYVSTTEPYGVARSTCTTSPDPPLGTLGANSSLILSKYPLVNTDKYILPSTYFRRSVLYGQVQFPGDLTVDVYCGFFSSTLIYDSLVYTGCFGDGNTSLQSQAAYTAENLYQGQLLASWVKGKSGPNPAVVLGDWHSSLGGGGDAGAGAFPPPMAFAPATMTYLAAQPRWVAVQGANWPASGQCSYCPPSVNVLNAGSSTSAFFLQPFLYGWPQGAAAVKSEQLLYTSNALTFGDAGAPNEPVSPYYGLNFQVLRPQ